ncbi:TnsD family Tn7-like transposition protein [Pseudomonas paralcaligenes]|uniref:TnsD family Tn7-like transposition protein n=1 Tax=Pseudomonas paralcaligenes TaxID=2772558 RepID=UPI0021D134A3|nr:TnsD family Tn7-like transposition protein [Pseudomonas paralcaligenes]
MTHLDLENYIYSAAPRKRSAANPKLDKRYLPSNEELTAKRLAFMNDGSVRCHDKAGYTWIYRHDRNWLRNYIAGHKYTRPPRLRVDWEDRDDRLLSSVASAHKELLLSKTKPIKLTRAALMRGASLGADFCRKPHKFPKTLDFMDGAIETEHEYQVRKVSWAVNQLPSSQINYISVILRVAGIRVRHISDFEIMQIIGARKFVPSQNGEC